MTKRKKKDIGPPNNGNPVDMPPEFMDSHNYLEHLQELGWHYTNNGYGWWFERRTTDMPTERVSPPYWVCQMVHEAFQNGQDVARSEIRQALGVDKKTNMRRIVIGD